MEERKITPNRLGSEFASSLGQECPRRGFALIVALSLMGFILLLLLSLSAMVQVQTAGVGVSKAKIMAQENARLGLFVALGELQKLAGPDQRVTATAELNYPALSNGNRYLTGVWDSTDTSTPLAWLISGGSPNPTVDIQSNLYAVTLVGEESVGTVGMNPNAANDYVYALSEDTGENGRYAWWVSDEGVKANVSETNDYNVYPNNVAVSDAVGRRERGVNYAQGGARVGIEALVGSEYSENGTFFQSENGTQLERLTEITSLNQVVNINDDFQAIHFHDLTTQSKGVLANTLHGGLRMNLDSPVFTDTNDPFTNGDLDGYLDYNNNYTSFQTRRYRTTYGLNAVNQMGEDWETNMPATPTSGYRAYHHLSPIITEMAIYFSVFHRSANGGSPGVRYQIEMELYNPYPFPILLSTADRKPLSVMVDGLPEIRVTKHPVSGSSVSSGWVKLDDLPVSSASGAVETASWLEITDGGVGATSSTQDTVGFLMPGEVYRLNEPNRVGGLLKFMAGYEPQSVENEDEVIIECRDPDGNAQGKLNVKLVKGYTYESEGLDTRISGDPSVFEIKNIPYEGDPNYFTYIYDRADGRPAGGRGSQSDKRYIQGSGNQGDVSINDSYIFAFHFRLGGGVGSTELEEFLKYYDLRNPSVDYEDSFTYTNEDGNEVTRNLADFIEQASQNPISTESAISGVFSQQPTFDAFWDKGIRSRDPEAAADEQYADIRLFDFPTQQVTSVAALRHAFFVGQSPLSLTSSYGGELNEAFDKYFFSSVPSAGWTPEGSVSLPNPHMSVSDTSASVAELRGYDSGQYLMVDGAFNINSTSVEAWQAILDQGTTNYSATGAERDPIFIRRTSSTGLPEPIDLENYFFRLPFGGLEYTKGLGDASLVTGESGLMTLSSSQLLRESTRQGFRSLNTSEGDDQIHQLAYHIVDGIQNQGHPFGSLSEFINSGIVEDAIEAVGPAIAEAGIPAVTPINEGIESFAPTYLRQTDIVTSLATQMSARSDTFKIRAYGDYRNPLTDEVIAQARVEATVQRMPEMVESGAVVDPMSNATSASGGRAFKIVSMRWLD